jgi:hypothetical protein
MYVVSAEIATGVGSVHVCQVRAGPSALRGSVTRASVEPESEYSEHTRSDVDDSLLTNKIAVMLPATPAENLTPSSTSVFGPSAVGFELNEDGTCISNRVDGAPIVAITNTLNSNEIKTIIVER